MIPFANPKFFGGLRDLYRFVSRACVNTAAVCVIGLRKRISGEP